MPEGRLLASSRSGEGDGERSEFMPTARRKMRRTSSDATRAGRPMGLPQLSVSVLSMPGWGDGGGGGGDGDGDGEGGGGGLSGPPLDIDSGIGLST